MRQLTPSEMNKRSEERTVAAWFDENRQPVSTVEVNGWKKLVALARGKATAQPPPPLPKGVFNVIVADPPWRYDFAESNTREIENQSSSPEMQDPQGKKRSGSPP